jgi:dsDNA-specific endonuclease/ATPase MutS2
VGRAARHEGEDDMKADQNIAKLEMQRRFLTEQLEMYEDLRKQFNVDFAAERQHLQERLEKLGEQVRNAQRRKLA